jgi:hypothetical protein
MANEVRHHEKRDREKDEDSQNEFRTRPIKRPFDTSEVNWVPEIENSDPPYRNWWVVENERDGR